MPIVGVYFVNDGHEQTLMAGSWNRVVENETTSMLSHFQFQLRSLLFPGFDRTVGRFENRICVANESWAWSGCSQILDGRECVRVGALRWLYRAERYCIR